MTDDGRNRRISRRQSLGMLAAGAAAAAGGGVLAMSGQEKAPGAGAGSGAGAGAGQGRMPSIFLAHGAPVLLEMEDWVAELAGWAGALPRPDAILMLSAHWEQKPLAIGATRPVPLVYDFYGFPERFYRQTYAAPGAPALAERVRALVAAAGERTIDEPARGLDHGAYVPLVAMLPDASVPVLQVSLPSQDPRALLALGRALAPLRDEGVLIVGSGFLTHNLRAMDLSGRASAPAWATEFDAWCADVLARRDADALLDYRARAPGVRESLPTHEHFVPVIVALGAAIDDAGAGASFPITGWAFGSGSKRSVQFG